VTLVEAFRARALALAASGQTGDALDAARQAATLSPEAPRHAALLASLALRAGDPALATRSLGDASRATGLRVVRAEIDLADGGDSAIAASEVELALAASDLTAPERARASLVRARIAAAAGNAAGTLTDLGAVEALAPTWDEPTRLSAAELLLSSGEAARARALLEALPSASVDGRRRAELLVRASLALGDIPAAERSVALAGTGPSIDFLRARIAEAAGRLDEARTLYASAASEPTLLVPARTAEGAILYARGAMAEARTALAAAIGGDPGDGRAVLLFVRAALATDDRAAADRAAQAARALHPERPEVAAAIGLVALSSGRLDEALSSLATATAALTTDQDLRLDLGVAQWRSGRLDEASATFDAVLGAAPTSLRALGLAIDLSLERARFDGASALLDRLAAAGASAAEVARRRAELAAARGLGRAAIEEVERASARSRDAAIWIALARLQIQAERDRDARRTLTRARRYDRRSPTIALLGIVLDAHDGRLRGVDEDAADAETEATSRGITNAFRALISAVRARAAFESSDVDEARQLAEAAVALDPLCAEAHLVLADVATVGSHDPIPELRLAAAGTYPMPEALGRLAARLERGEEACTSARLYDERAHGGYDQDDVDEVLERCP
jgi:tetratricopeptide (TPR) repeat protein